MSDPHDGIRWSPEFSPPVCAVHVGNELAMAVPAAHVWAWLIRAQLWPTWYSNSKNVRILNGAPPDLALGTRFRWRTFGAAIESEVVEFVPGQRIAWNATGLGVTACHAWLLRETTEGCHVLTEERQHGWAARFQHLVWPGRMPSGHQNWLESLRDYAAGGPPKA